MAYRVELSGAAARALREASETGWATNHDEIAEAELERARFLYDGAVTGAGYLWLKIGK